MDCKIVTELFNQGVPVNVRLPDGSLKKGRICALGGTGQNVLASVACENGDTLRAVPPKDLSLALARL